MKKKNKKYKKVKINLKIYIKNLFKKIKTQKKKMNFSIQKFRIQIVNKKIFINKVNILN